MNIKFHYLLMCSLLSLLFLACDDEDEQLQPFSANFSNTEIGFSDDESEKTVDIIFSRATTEAGIANITIDAGSLRYGEQNDYFTEPAAENNSLQIPFENGVNSVSFTLHKGTALNIAENASISFELQQSSELFQIGPNSEVTAEFSENFIASSGTVTLDAGGPDFPVVAFFDISKNKQTRVDKYSWDLGFYNGAENRVTVNNTANVMARPLNKTDMADVTAEDTVGFAQTMTVGFTGVAEGAFWIDDHTGDLSATAFGEIATSSDDAKVFIIKRDGDDRNWKKVRVFTNASGYTIEYADISAESFETVEVSKDEAFNFSYFDMDNGVVNVAPAKDSWDFMYSTYAVRYSMGGPAIPYGFNDYIIINRFATEVAMVLKSDVSFTDFDITDAEALEYASNINGIGSSWRSGGGPNSSPEEFKDRFYILKDSQDNYYKVEFLDLTANDAEERGHLNLKYELLD